jgi:hypothetical protein
MLADAHDAALLSSYLNVSHQDGHRGAFLFHHLSEVFLELARGNWSTDPWTGSPDMHVQHADTGNLPNS